MEYSMHLRRWERRRPDWAAAAVAGFAAGAVLMVLELIWAAVDGSDGPWRISQLVAALVLGPDSLQASPYAFDAAVVALALVTHYLLGVVFGLALGFILAGLHCDTSVVAMQVIGAAFGVLLYLINFHGVTALVPWFAELRGWTNLVAHLVFGMTAAILYWQLARRGGATGRGR